MRHPLEDKYAALELGCVDDFLSILLQNSPFLVKKNFLLTNVQEDY